MIIKTFTAESSAAALKKVREEMGGDAIVLKTSQITNVGGKPIFEVTACLEKPTVAQSTKIFPDNTPKLETTEINQSNRFQGDADETDIKKVELDEDWIHKIDAIEQKLKQVLKQTAQPYGTEQFGMFQDVFLRLKEADLDYDYIDMFISSLSDDCFSAADVSTRAREKLVAELASMMLPELKIEPGSKLVFMGLAGCGKSSVMGKLAASLVAGEKQKINLATLDDFKMAAFDELTSYAEILGVDVANPLSCKEDTPKDKVITLIDTPALPAKSEQRRLLKNKIEQINPDYRFAVFSCLTRSRDILEISKQLKDLKPTHLIMTMLDLTDCFGAMLTAAKSIGVRITFVTNSPGGIGKLHVPDPDLIARQLLKTEVSCE